jgi:hypothetical protein
MYILYVDESGDPGSWQGRADGNSKHFILSGIIIPMVEWNGLFENIKGFRRQLRTDFGLAMRIELHASELIRIGSIDAYRDIHKSDRLRILQRTARELPTLLPMARIINVCLDKMTSGVHDVKETAWTRMLTRYNTFLQKSVGGASGIVVADGIEDPHIRLLARKLHVYNPTPSHTGGYYNYPLVQVLEDPFHRDSRNSYFTQIADVVAHLLYRREYPKGSLRKFGIERLFEQIEPLLLKEASKSDPLGVVRK